MQNLAYFDADADVGYVTVVDGVTIVAEHETLRANPGKCIRVYDRDGRNPQLCVGGDLCGNTLNWSRNPDRIPQEFASDCRARLFKTRAGYDRARTRLDDSWTHEKLIYG